jgi:hypothetical protein
MATLLPCPRCGGFLPPAQRACVHCGAAVAFLPRAPLRSPHHGPGGRSLLSTLLALAGAGVASVTLMACYGAPDLDCDTRERRTADGGLVDGCYACGPAPDGSTLDPEWCFAEGAGDAGAADGGVDGGTDGGR